MLTSGNETFEYDDNGNLVRKTVPEGETLYTYDYDNRLTQVQLPQGTGGSGDTVTKQLTQGWNFIALPGNGTLPNALTGFNFGIDYDHLIRLNNTTENAEYFVNNTTFNDFNTLDSWRGYEIYVNNPSGKLLSYDASGLPNSFTVQLKAGWQLAGFPVREDTPVSALNIDCIQILEYNKSTGTLQPVTEGNPAGTTTVKPLTAYFIECANDTTVSYTNPPPGDPGTPGEAISFTYDGDGKRISKTASGTTTQYIWDLDNISEEVTGSLKKCYIHGPKVDEIARRSDYATGMPRSDYYYHADGLGSVSQITDYAGAKLVDYSYDVFGEIRKQTGAESGNTYLFCGRLWDGEIELYYNRARYYSPKYGRFMSKDTHKYDGYDPGGIHRYLYADNNPIIFIDPYGFKKLWYERLKEKKDIKAEKIKEKLLEKIPNNIFAVAAAAAVTTGIDVVGGIADIPSAYGHLGEGTGKFSAQPTLENAAGLAQDIALTAGTLATAGAVLQPKTLDIKVIGRQQDTAVAKNWPGHDVLDLPKGKWTPQKNASWVDKGIGNKQPFYKASPETMENIWKTKTAKTVYGQELDRVRAAGYKDVGDCLLP